MQDPRLPLHEINALAAEAARAAQIGREQEAIRVWGRILDIDPNHAPTLTALGQHAFRRGDLSSARTAFQRVVDTDGQAPHQWINLALVHQKLKDEQGEENAVQRALSIDPGDLLALILRANLFERQGKRQQAARNYGAAATASPPLEQLHPELRSAVMHAVAFREEYDKDCGVFMDRYLDSLYKEFQGENLKRFRDSLDIMTGRKKRYDSQSIIYHFPNLAPIEFFERADFPWLDPIEAATDAIRDELLGVLHTEEGFEPYITYPDDVPHNQFAELNNSPRWSAFHLYKMGSRIEENAAKCPATMHLLDNAPQPDQPGRTPAAMFSLLKPNTRIPPHTGVSNVRLVTHVPLIVPEGCGFRVGNDTREWVPGRAWVFDDTIDHEAWNESDKLRVVLLFDIWHPHLTLPERTLITALSAGINAFSGEVAGFEP